MRTSLNTDCQAQASTSGRLDSTLTGARSPPRRSRRQQTPRALAGHDAGSREITLLDYGAGNVRSVRNAIRRLGYTLKDVGAQKPSHACSLHDMK